MIIIIIINHHHHQSLGALTQGDRDATAGSSTMSSAAFNIDTGYGSKALREFCFLLTSTRKSRLREMPKLDDEDVDELAEQHSMPKESITFAFAATKW